LLLATVLLRRDRQCGACGLHLGIAGGGVLVGGPGVDAQQQLPGLHAVTTLTASSTTAPGTWAAITVWRTARPRPSKPDAAALVDATAGAAGRPAARKAAGTGSRIATVSAATAVNCRT